MVRADAVSEVRARSQTLEPTHVRYAGWGLLALFALLLWGPMLQSLWSVWNRMPAMSHGPVLLALALGHLWLSKESLKDLSHASRLGLAALTLTALLFVAASFADVVFLKGFTLLAMTCSAVWFLGGWRAMAGTAGALGFLVFAIPWPTTVLERLAFPLQMMSSTYAAMAGGMLGLPIVREGVQLSVMDGAGKEPIYQVLVAQGCSGLTSLMVLLGLGYLLAYHTPLGLGWRGLMLAVMVPLTLIANTVRITLILLAGAYYSPALAKWVHDHEAPVLIFFCSLGLLALRQGLMAWQQSGPTASAGARVETEGDPYA